MLAVAVVTPKFSLDDALADESAYFTIMPSIGNRKKRVKIPVIKCPVCADKIAVKTTKRPARVSCDGCDTRLKIS
jgi:hypothetical protein